MIPKCVLGLRSSTDFSEKDYMDNTTQQVAEFSPGDTVMCKSERKETSFAPTSLMKVTPNPSGRVAARFF